MTNFDSHEVLIGVDEAGRGSLAGPVFAGAVILNFEQTFRDSKALSPQKREFLAQEIKKHHKFGIGFATIQEIEELNIHQASLLAMRRAVESLKVKAGYLLIDGLHTLASFGQFKQTAFVKGDSRIPSIMAAGIMAKTERDKLFLTYGKKYPYYGFERHKGYGTKKHKEAIQTHGPCPIHRLSFSGVKEFL